MEKSYLKYFSTFTGIGGFERALKLVFDRTEMCGYSEWDTHAEKTYLKNFPTHKGLNYGDIGRLVFDVDKKGNFIVNTRRVEMLPDFDFLFGGPPCQNLSIAKSNREGLGGEKSIMFYAFAAILQIKKPKYFLMENVKSMHRDDRETISEYLGYEPRSINSDLFGPQKRERLYWFNWDLPDIEPPENPDRWENLVAWSRSTRYPKDAEKYVEQRETTDGRANTLTTGAGCGSFSSKNFIKMDCGNKRPLSPIECERLQGFPVDWTEGVSTAQRYKQIGNAIEVRTVEYILKGLKEKIENERKISTTPGPSKCDEIRSDKVVSP